MTHRTAAGHKLLMCAAALALLAVMVLPGSVGAAEKGTERPFHYRGTAVHTIGWDGLADRCPVDPILGAPVFRTFISDGEGRARHLGLTTVAGDHCTYLAPGGGFTFQGGWWVATAANGDRLFAPYRASAQQPAPSPDPNVILANASHTFVGGTGRFEEATGWMECAIRMVVTDWATFTADLSADCYGEISY